MKKRYNVVFNLVLIVLVLGVFLHMDFKEVWFLLKQINLFWFFLAFFSFGIMFLLWNIRFFYSLQTVSKTSLNFFYVFLVLFSGIFMNTITPGSNIGGEPVRAYYLSKKYKKPKTKFLGAILADKTFNILAFGIFLILSILFLALFIKIPDSLKYFLEGIILVIFFVSFIFLFFIFKKLNFDFKKILLKIYSLNFIKKKFSSSKIFINYIKIKLSNISRSFKKVLLNKKVFIIGFCLSIFLWILIFLCSYLLFIAFGLRISFFSVAIVISIGYLIGDLSPIPGGIGLVESSMFLLYSSMGISGSVSAAVSLLSRIIYYFYALIVGGLSLWILRIKDEK